MKSKSVNGVLTLDVEDWDHANYSQLTKKKEQIYATVRERKYAMDSNIELWINLLDKAGAKSTCFVLGDFSQRFPHAVQKLDQAGHEIASHGAAHDLIYEMSQKQFREYLKKGVGEIGDLTGKAPIGFRAPSWSCDSRIPWFCEELVAQNIKYDSSLFPAKTPLFGQFSGPIKPYWEGSLLRVPVSVFWMGNIRLPFSSGAFFRLTPLSLIRKGLDRSQSQGQVPMVVLHPRELDPTHPRLPLEGWERVIHYANLRGVISKLEALLKEVTWNSLLNRYRSKLDTPGSVLDN